MEKVLSLYKKEGETPLECLNRFRAKQSEYKDAVLSYVGRLDPMAEGVLLVVVGEENKNREAYLGFDKVYEVDILFGISTDTGDILGKVVEVSKSVVESDFNFLESFIGSFSQKYPHYSSKTVGGKPLFEWAREGKLDEIKIPEKEVEIYNIIFKNQYILSSEEILKQVEERILKVNGNFRQEEIIDSWQENLLEKTNEYFSLINIEVSCSSGTYMRTLAEEIGKKLKTPALAWRIKRTSVLASPEK